MAQAILHILKGILHSRLELLKCFLYALGAASLELGRGQSLGNTGSVHCEALGFKRVVRELLQTVNLESTILDNHMEHHAISLPDTPRKAVLLSSRAFWN